MTYPFLSTTYVDPELVTSANFYSRVLAPLNTFGGGFLYGEAEGASTDSVTLTTTGNFVVPVATVTFVLTQQRRIRFKVAARVQSGTAVGPYNIQCAYVSGASATLSGATLLGQSGADQFVTPATGGTSAVAGHAEHTALVAAGTWTAFAACGRITNGSATDVAALGYCAVYDAGGS